MTLYTTSDTMMVAKGYSLRDLNSTMERAGFALWHAVDSHPFYGTSIAFVSKIDVRGVFVTLTVRSSGVRGFFGLRVVAKPLPSHGRIVEVVDFGQNTEVQSNHDVRTAAGVKKFQVTLQGIGEPARSAGTEISTRVLARTVNIRRAFIDLASTLPGDLFELAPILTALRTTAHDSEKRIAQRLLPSPLRLPFNTDDELGRVKDSYEIATLMVATMQARKGSGDHLPLQPEEREDCVELLASWVFNPWLFKKLNVQLPIWNDI